MGPSLMTGLPWLVPVLCAITLAAIGFSAHGARRWAAQVEALNRSLDAARTVVKRGMTLRAYCPSTELPGLPAPVQRYFTLVLKEGQALVATAAIEMVGTFDMAATTKTPRPFTSRRFTSRQRVETARPGFLWDARISMAPCVVMRVIDSYIQGSGRLRASVWGLFTVAKVQGTGEIARGEFMRFAAEAAWYPTALLPSQGVQWEAVDAHSANATIDDGPLAVTLLFGFDDTGLISTVRAQARGCMVGSRMVMMPWECRLSNYEVCNGMTVPMRGEAAWIGPHGRKPYFQGTVTSLAHEFRI